MERTEHTVTLNFPGDIEYVPDIRRFLATIISLRSFSRRFAFRMEIIIDELSTNAIKFGKLRVGEFVTIICRIRDNEVVLDVCSPGSEACDIQKLKKTIATDRSQPEIPFDFSEGRGVPILKILCNSIQVLEQEGYTVRVIKKKNENEEL
jgi:anti-sigma regulatory factor (Ser/Thr protein kinase)